MDENFLNTGQRVEWQPIDSLPTGNETVLLARADGLVGPARSWFAKEYINSYTHWMPLPEAPTTNPMTVAEWQPMELLPDHHPDDVVIEHYDGFRLLLNETTRKYDKSQNRRRWVSLDALLEAAGLSDE